MLIVAFLFAISINFDKIVMLNSDPFFGMALTVMSIGMACLVLSAYSHFFMKNRESEVTAETQTQKEPSPGALSLKQYAGLSFLIGLFVTIEGASVNIAYTLQIVPYVIAIKRMSIIFMVLYGTIVFAERDIRKRVMGAALMVAGAVIILLFS